MDRNAPPRPFCHVCGAARPSDLTQPPDGGHLCWSGRRGGALSEASTLRITRVVGLVAVALTVLTPVLYFNFLPQVC